MILAGPEGEAAFVEILGVTHPRLCSLMGALELFLMEDQVSEELDDRISELIETMKSIFASI